MPQARLAGLVPPQASRPTPGPWKALVEKRGRGYGWSVGGAYCVLARVLALQGADYGSAEGNARLIAAAPDHALVGWAMCVQDATWEEWGEGKGELCFAGLRHATTLDEFGCPVLTDNLRSLLTKSRDNALPSPPRKFEPTKKSAGDVVI